MANITVTPQGQVYLCKTPLENDYKNQLTFASSTAQYNYFNSKVFKSYDNYTYIKKDNVIMVGENIDVIINCNYLFYRNTGFTSKWYYCFITNMEYVNENCTRVTIETDAFQTWQFQIDYKPCFVEREHVNDDTVGLHTVPENVETGEYVQANVQYYDELDEYQYVLQVTELDRDAGPAEDIIKATNYGGIPMTGGAYVCDTFQELVDSVTALPNPDAAYNAYICPKVVINNQRTDSVYSGNADPFIQEFGFNKPTTIDNTYTPVNKKLLTFPYNYLLVSNNNGSSNILHYEQFNRNDVRFIIKGVPTVGGSIKCSPKNYDGIEENEEQGVMAGKFPTLNWGVDEYTNWLTQNSVNIGVGVAGSVISGVASFATGNPIGTASSILGVANTLGQIYQHSLQPNSARGNVNGGDINFCDSKMGFFFYQMTIKREYAQIIDNFFSMFGYKVNLVKVPNITGRQNWNYVKTINCNFEGDIPQNDLNTIKQMFDNGVTLWHNPANIYNYNLTNNIVS